MLTAEASKQINHQIRLDWVSPKLQIARVFGSRTRSGTRTHFFLKIETFMKINLPRNPSACQTLVKAKIQNACTLCISVYHVCMCVCIYIYMYYVAYCVCIYIYKERYVYYICQCVWIWWGPRLHLNFQNCKHSKQILTDLLPVINLVRHEHLEVHSGKHSQETDWIWRIEENESKLQHWFFYSIWCICCFDTQWARDYIWWY